MLETDLTEPLLKRDDSNSSTSSTGLSISDRTPLLNALAQKDIPLAKWLIENDQDITAQDGVGMGILHLVVQQDLTSFFDWLQKNLPATQLQYLTKQIMGNGFTPVLLAAFYNHKNLFQKLLPFYPEIKEDVKYLGELVTLCLKSGKTDCLDVLWRYVPDATERLRTYQDEEGNNICHLSITLHLAENGEVLQYIQGKYHENDPLWYKKNNQKETAASLRNKLASIAPTLHLAGNNLYNTLQFRCYQAIAKLEDLKEKSSSVSEDVREMQDIFYQLRERERTQKGPLLLGMNTKCYRFDDEDSEGSEASPPLSRTNSEDDLQNLTLRSSIESTDPLEDDEDARSFAHPMKL